MRTCGEVLNSRHTESKADAHTFCPSPDRSNFFAVLGIFTVDSHAMNRHEIRLTWMPVALSSGIIPRFVLHGLNALMLSHNESTRHDDIVFLKAAAEQSCKIGPLHKLLLWLTCAIQGRVPW